MLSEQSQKHFEIHAINLTIRRNSIRQFLAGIFQGHGCTDGELPDGHYGQGRAG
jgi:hypothetical protein